MRNGRSKLNIPYLVAAIALLALVVLASLYFFPEWRESLAMMIALLVVVTVGVVGFAANFTSAFIRDSVDTPSVALDYDSPQHRRNQENVCANVRSAWIDGVLRDSLQERVRLELALDSPPGMLQRAIRPVEGQEPRRPLESTADIADIYRAGARSLLILGAPGSGKTMTLLELCRPILEGAEVDPRRPVPVVLNLSTWAQKQAPLAEWIADEMRRQYDLSRAVTPVWLAADHMTLLLDGLDEVSADARDACVRAINAFRETHSAGMAICSRSADYADLRERLALSKAVEILPLTPSQIAAYLSDERLALDGVREAIARDDALGELATTPLMLNVMAAAYGGRLLVELLPLLDSEIERRAHLYDAYIARMFSRKPLTGTGYTAAQALRWLRFLAARLIERDETQFFIEDLQPDWVPGRLWRGLLLLGGVLGGVLGGGIASLYSDRLVGILLSILVGGFFGGIIVLATAIGKYKPIDVLVYDLSRRTFLWTFYDNWILIFFFGGVGGLLSHQLSEQPHRVFFGVLLGALFGFLGLGLGDSTYLLRPRQSKDHRNRPNDGIRRSAANAARGSIMMGIALGVLFGILFWLLGLGFVGMLIGIVLGVLEGSRFYGITPVFKHYILRLLLALHHLLPLRLVPFLEAMRERILMQRAGGHYRFIHRTLQEHIAALTDDRIERLT